MAKLRISGVWKDSGDVITHYAVHTEHETTISRAEKTSKANLIALLEKPGNSAVTWLWSYTQCKFKIGEDVYIVNGKSGKYLRSNPDQH